VPDYLVITSIDSAVKTERIVRAKNSAGALRHVVADTISVRQAHIDDAMRLATTTTARRSRPCSARRSRRSRA
jgi:hypothetical protein